MVRPVQQVQQVLGIREIVDRDHLEPVESGLGQRAQHAAADAAKAVDAYTDHFVTPLEAIIEPTAHF